MVQTGDECCCGDHTRCYFDERWDVIYSEDEKFYWRDKWDHVTYDGNAASSGALQKDGLGEIVPLFDNKEEDALWDRTFL